MTNFQECVTAGNPVMESFPRQCRSRAGELFVEEVSQEDIDNQVFCTMDAKVCPDGTSVGRVPPSCEFAPCPGEVED